MKKLIYFMFCTLSFLYSTAQTEISGNVKDNSGNPIPGVNVLIKGSTSGTTTDFDGNFSFTTNETGSRIIQFSSVGYKTLENAIELNGTAVNVSIVLQETTQQLDEVLLTASSTFRSQKEAPLSISSKKIKEITRLSANSQADILRDVPGITAEGGGGETATNLR